MSRDKKQFLDDLKKDIETLTPYKNNYSMSDILAIKEAYNNLAVYNNARSYCYSIKRFFSKKNYYDFIIVYKSTKWGCYIVTF